MTKKIRVGILYGGKSAEHEVSIRSAKNIIDALDKNKYEPILIGIDKTGRWLPEVESKSILKGEKIDKKHTFNTVALAAQDNGRIIETSSVGLNEPIDVFFPVLHGPFGEDGTIQGLLKLANVPFVGAGVLGSAIGMDKDVMKRLLRDAGLSIAKFQVIKKHELADISFKKIKKELGLPLFVKPANLGSSVGVSKVHSEKEFEKAIDSAFLYDNKILIEENISGREIECSVLGNEKPAASLPGEIIPKHEFYSYEAKYLDENGAELKIPAELTKSTIKNIQKMAIKTFEVLCCEGMARVDFFLTKDNKIIVNEINTIPGFTSISMYPKLWEASGMPYSKLIDTLIELAIDRFNGEGKLKTSFILE